MLGWGNFIIQTLDIVVFLYLDPEIRIQRLIKREKQRYGHRIEPGNDLYTEHLDFIEYAKNYETGGIEIRSKFSHEEWLKKLPCKTIRIEQDISVQQKVEYIMNVLYP